MKEQLESAAKDRSALHVKVDALNIQVLHLTGVSYDVQKDTAEIKKDIEEKIMPTIDGYKLSRAKLSGIITASRVIWGIMVAICAGIGFLVHQVVQYLRH